MKLLIWLGPIFVLICEDIISWMHRLYVLVRATNEYHEKWPNLNSNDSTVYEYPYPLWVFLCFKMTIQRTHVYIVSGLSIVIFIEHSVHPCNVSHCVINSCVRKLMDSIFLDPSSTYFRINIVHLNVFTDMAINTYICWSKTFVYCK